MLVGKSLQTNIECKMQNEELFVYDIFKLQIKKLSTAANETQSIYGTRSNAATRDSFQNNIILARMLIHKTTISTTAQPGFRSPKKMIDQRALRTS